MDIMHKSIIFYNLVYLKKICIFSNFIIYFNWILKLFLIDINNSNFLFIGFNHHQD